MATKPTDDKPTDDKPTEEKSSGDKPAQAEAAAAGASGSKSATPAAAASTSGGAKASTKSEPKAASSAATAATQSQSGQSSFPPKATPAPPPAPPHRHGGWAGPFVAGALVVVLAVVVTVATRHQWQPMFGDSGSDTGTQQAMAALEQKVSSFESALGDLKSQVEAGAGEAASKVASKVEALEQKADGLASRIGKLEAKPEGPEPATAAAVEALAKKQDALATQVDKLESLGKEQDALSARVAKLEAGPEVPPASAADLSAVSAETKSLAQKLAESDSHIAALGESASKLQASLDQMAADQAKAKAAMKREAGLALSLAQLRDALRFSGPFNTELKQVQGVVGDDAELSGLLKPLEGHAADGVPTVDRLRRDFEDAARHIVAAGQGDESDSLLDGVLRRVSNIVTVRRVGEVEGNDTGAVVARAEAKLAEGDLARAVAELDALKGHAAKAAASWRTEADARLAADRAVNALSARTIANVTPTGG